MWPILLLALIVSPAVPAASSASSCADDELAVTFLANEGFLLRTHDAGVLIDAFVVEPYAGYGFLPSNLAEALSSAAEPFDSVQLVLASHRHADHFQAEPAGRFLSSAPDARLASSPQVIEAFREGFKDTEAVEDQLSAVLPEPGETVAIEHTGISVDALRLSHGRGSEIDNLGHLVHLDDWNVLHLGDAEPSENSFAPYALAERDIDVVLVPYWFFLSAEGHNIMRRHIRAPHTIAAHIAPNEVSIVGKQLASTHPDVIVPEASGDAWCLERQ